VILLAVMLHRRFGIATTALLAATLVILAFWVPWAKGLVNAGAEPVLRPLYAFVFGVAVYQLGSAAWSRLSRATGFLVFAASLLVFWAAGPLLGYASTWSHIFVAAACAVMIGVIAYAPGGGLAKPLDWPIARFYGRISYSFYLLHPLTLIVIWRIPEQLTEMRAAGVPGPLIAAALAVLSIAAVTPLAWLSWRFVERPGIRGIRRLIVAIDKLETRAKPSFAAGAKHRATERSFVTGG
jgi:peptidoglycan/LPS O-acetylase OafA/YrhL